MFRAERRGRWQCARARRPDVQSGEDANQVPSQDTLVKAGSVSRSNTHHSPIPTDIHTQDGDPLSCAANVQAQPPDSELAAKLQVRSTHTQHTNVLDWYIHKRHGFGIRLVHIHKRDCVVICCCGPASAYLHKRYCERCIREANAAGEEHSL